uniref:Uncharacterized protein n=1 Tax=Rhizophora mucronata TaxID=61149 RepID=A0A2P2PFM6_RHIMU
MGKFYFPIFFPYNSNFIRLIKKPLFFPKLIN